MNRVPGKSVTLGIFTLLTIGDFARIRAGGDGQSAVSLSLSICLDVINIFLAVLQLLSGVAGASRTKVAPTDTTSHIVQFLGEFF